MKINLSLGIIVLFVWNFLNSQNVKQKVHVLNDSVYIDIVNPFYAPIELNLSALDSTKSFASVKPYGILHHQDTLKNALALPMEKVKDTADVVITDYVKFKGSFGDPDSEIDYDYRYSLPFPKNLRYKIVQSFGGSFSHNKPSSRYAIDIGTQIGDTITAIRPGIVFFVKEDSKEHCRTSKCIDKGNKVLILHDDGSMAHYVHLDFDGAIVEVGDRVKDSQPIGISGLTGFTTTPHLHLVIFKANSISIPFKFKGQKGKKLKQGRYYRRLH